MRRSRLPVTSRSIAAITRPGSGLASASTTTSTEPRSRRSSPCRSPAAPGRPPGPRRASALRNSARYGRRSAIASTSHEHDSATIRPPTKIGPSRCSIASASSTAAISAWTPRTTTVSTNVLTRPRTSSGSGSHKSSVEMRCKEWRSAPSAPLVSTVASTAPPISTEAVPPATRSSGSTQKAARMPSRRTRYCASTSCTTSAAAFIAA